MSELFKWLRIGVVVFIADGLLCLFLAFLTDDDNDKWIPAFVLTVLGFIVSLTVLIGGE